MEDVTEIKWSLGRCEPHTGFQFLVNDYTFSENSRWGLKVKKGKRYEEREKITGFCFTFQVTLYYFKSKVIENYSEKEPLFLV